MARATHAVCREPAFSMGDHSDTHRLPVELRPGVLVVHPNRTVGFLRGVCRTASGRAHVFGLRSRSKNILAPRLGCGPHGRNPDRYFRVVRAYWPATRHGNHDIGKPRWLSQGPAVSRAIICAAERLNVQTGFIVQSRATLLRNRRCGFRNRKPFHWEMIGRCPIMAQPRGRFSAKAHWRLGRSLALPNIASPCQIST